MREDALKTTVNNHGLEYGDPVFIRIFKQEAELELWIKDK